MGNAAAGAAGPTPVLQPLGAQEPEEPPPQQQAEPTQQQKAEQQKAEQQKEEQQKEDKPQRGKVVQAILVTEPSSEASDASNEPADKTGERAGGEAQSQAGSGAVAGAAVPGDAQARRVVEEQVEVREVLLDVLVTDRDGNVVRGLGPSDFVVKEGGRQHPVVSVAFYGGEEQLEASGEGSTARSDRHFILFFDDVLTTQVGSLITSQIRAGNYAQQWLQELLPNDQVAVLSFSHSLRVYQDFTRDREATAQAIAAAVRGRKPPVHEISKPLAGAVPDSPSLLLNLPTGRALRREATNLQEALKLVGTAAEGIVGRKNLILFSIGFSDYDVFPYRPDPRYYPSMKEALNAGNVAVYALDLVGTSRSGPGRTTPDESLSLIADDTGGILYFNAVNVVGPLRQVAEDNLGYYLISFLAEHEDAERGYQEVKVEALDPRLRVRARQGYRFGDS